MPLLKAFVGMVVIGAIFEIGSAGAQETVRIGFSARSQGRSRKMESIWIAL
jgi:hypothetical protein